MNAQEAIKYTKAVIDSAVEWVNGDAPIHSEIELLIIADHYGVNLPACMHHFRYSNSPNHACATGAHKTVSKVLNKLKVAIITKQAA